MAEIKIGLGTNNDGTPFTITQDISGKTQNYSFFYDTTSKKGNLFPVDDSGNKIAGGETIWTDGAWKGTNIKDGSLTKDVLDGYNTQLVNQLKSQLAAIRNKRTSGAAAKAEYKEPAWATNPASSNLPVGWLPGQPSASSPPSPTSQPASPPSNNGNWWDNIPLLTNDQKSALGAFTQAILDPYKSIDNVGISNGRWDMANDKSGNLIYPIDLTKMQDYFKIECYRYQAPYASTMKEYVNTGDLAKTFGQGVRRGTALKGVNLKGDPLGTIILPMPQDVRDTNAVRWADDNMNNLSAAALGYTSKNATNMLGLMVAGTLAGGASGIQGLGNLANKGFFYGSLLGAGGGQGGAAQGVIGPAIQSMLAGQLGIDISPETILSRVGGVIQNTNTELMFRGVQTRSFNFVYRMSARSPQEALVIRKIIRYLKQWSAARKVSKNISGQSLGADQPSFFLGTPNVFKLSYRTNNGSPIAGVNRFKQCALTKISTNYTPDGEWNAFEGGMPVSVQIDMTFAELEPLYNTDYSGVKDYNFPANIVTPDSAEVGY
jgi:hypothetical protein